MPKLYIIIITFSFLLVGCSGDNHSKLQHVDAIMEENADSALNILKRINRSTISDKDLPYYALLMTQALVKTNVPVDSDSLISIAYSKYNDDWWGDKGIRSNYYIGEVYFNQEKSRQAMTHYLNALEEAKRQDNYYWRAKAADRIADIFFNAYNYEMAAKYRMAAIEYFGESGKLTNQRYAIADLAIDYINNSRYDEARILLDSIYNKAIIDSPNDTLLLQYLRSPRIDILIATDRINEIDSIDLYLLDKTNYDSSLIEAEIIKNQISKKLSDEVVLNQFGNIPSNSFSDDDIVRMLYSRFEQAKSNRNTQLATEIADSLLYYQNLIAENIIKESANGAQRDFYLEMSDKDKRKSQFFFICFLAAFLGAIAIWWIYRLRNRARAVELEVAIESFAELNVKSQKLSIEKSNLETIVKEKCNSIEDLKIILTNKSLEVKLLEKEILEFRINKNELENDVIAKDNRLETLTNSLYEKTRVVDSLNNEIRNLQTELNDQKLSIELLEKNLFDQSNDLKNKEIILETLFKEKWTTLNTLCREYYEKGDSPNMRKHIIDSMEKELKKIGSTTGLAQIEATVDSHFGGIIRLLRSECHNLSEKDITLAKLYIAGLSVKAICYLMQIKTGNFYVSKRRLIERILATEAADKELFLEKLK